MGRAGPSPAPGGRCQSLPEASRTLPISVKSRQCLVASIQAHWPGLGCTRAARVGLAGIRACGGKHWGCQMGVVYSVELAVRLGIWCHGGAGSPGYRKRRRDWHPGRRTAKGDIGRETLRVSRGSARGHCPTTVALACRF